MPRKYLAVIFDVDGTLVDSNHYHARAWSRAFAEAGFAVSSERLRPLIGMRSENILFRIAGLSRGSSVGKQINERRKEIFDREYLPQARTFLKTKNLVMKLKTMGIKVAIACRISSPELKEMNAIHIQPPDSEHSLLDEALRILKVPPEQALMVGDTPYDIECAGRAGVAAIAFRTGGWKDASLGNAIAIYDDPEDLWLRLGSSPLGRVMAG